MSLSRLTEAYCLDDQLTKLPLIVFQKIIELFNCISFGEIIELLLGLPLQLEVV